MIVLITSVQIDDGLSAMRLPDGSLKVWIHVADPTRWLSYDHPLIKSVVVFDPSCRLQNLCSEQQSPHALVC